ncbi:hypothetical protein EDD85DRAFT_783008 [Armillaria nabsnona]|nr:hypothetical protein EDD85DRAFT_783008 [Armillaria nabsnona]
MAASADYWFSLVTIMHLKIGEREYCVVSASIIEEVEIHNGEHEVWIKISLFAHLQTSTLQNTLALLKLAEKNYNLQAYLEEIERHVTHIQQALSILFDNRIGPHSTFVDLGSRVGNVCSQGYKHKGQINLHHGYMKTNGTIMPAIRKTDVIYINNFKFEPFFIF